jgi:predicted nucleotidyltransferase component of viral defense system
MIHENKNMFRKIISSVSEKTGFTPYLTEKDYYLTMILTKVKDLSKDLVFKGGTSLNKIYFGYHRFSEDLDFNLSFRLPIKAEKKVLQEYIMNKVLSFRLPIKAEKKKPSFSPRKEALSKIENNINSFMFQFGLTPTKELEKRDGSRQYNFEFGYNSIVTNKVETVKFEVRSRDHGIILPIETHLVKHKFRDPFTNESMIKGGKVNVLSLKEVLADKLAAAINRTKPRDFYDIDYSIRNNFDFSDVEFIEVLKKKLQDDGNSIDISKYKENLGLSDAIISKVQKETTTTLDFVLPINEKKIFNFIEALKNINNTMENIIKIEKMKEKAATI